MNILSSLYSRKSILTLSSTNSIGGGGGEDDWLDSVKYNKKSTQKRNNSSSSSSRSGVGKAAGVEVVKVNKSSVPSAAHSLNVVANLESQEDEESAIHNSNSRDLDAFFDAFMVRNISPHPTTPLNHAPPLFFVQSNLKKSSSPHDLTRLVQDIYSSPASIALGGADEVLDNLLSESRRLQWDAALRDAKNPEIIKRTRKLLARSFGVVQKKNKSMRRKSRNGLNWTAVVRDVWDMMVSREEHPLVSSSDALVESIVNEEKRGN